MKEATPQDTFDHIFGSGAEQYDWWVLLAYWGYTYENGDVVPSWQVRVTCYDGEGGRVTRFVNHERIMWLARLIVMTYLEGRPGYGKGLVSECANLLFNADNTDFDSCLADEMLQLLVLEDVVFG